MWPFDPVIISSAAQAQTKNNSGSSAVETLCMCFTKRLADTELPLKQQRFEYKCWVFVGNDGQKGEIKLKEGNKKTEIVRLYCLTLDESTGHQRQRCRATEGGRGGRLLCPHLHSQPKQKWQEWKLERLRSSRSVSPGPLPLITRSNYPPQHAGMCREGSSLSRPRLRWEAPAPTRWLTRQWHIHHNSNIN